MADVKKGISILITSLIFIFIGMTATTITGGVGLFVVTKLNESTQGAITQDINMFSPNNLGLISTVFLFVGLVLLVYSVSIIIQSLMESIKGMREAGIPT